MQSAWVLALTSSAIILDFAYGLTEVTDVTASANGWDTRVSGSGCAPNGCLPSNVLDNSIEPASRWACQAASAGIDVCELTLEFDTPQDLLHMDMAFHKGDERTRSMNIWVDGVLLSTIVSSGTTTDYETYPLVARQASVVVLQAADLGDNEWLSITEVKLYADDGVGSEPSPAPTSGESGPVEVTGVTASANGWDTRVSGSGCAPNGCLPSNVLDNSIEPASRWACQAASAGIDVCELTLEFDAPQDLVQMDMAFYKGDERIRSVNVWVDGVLLDTITSSGETADYETYPLVARQASVVVLQAADLGDYGWLSITEVKFMAGDITPSPSSTTLPPSPTPHPTFPFAPMATTSTTEIPPSVQYAGLPDIVFDAVLEDAPYGFANGVTLTDQNRGIVLLPEDGGIAEFTGNVRLFDDEQTALAESITLYYYVYSDLDDPVTSFTRGLGEVDPSSGNFSASVPAPDGKSEVALSFVVLDEADRTTNLYPDTFIVRDVLNDCGDSYMTITLEEWDNEDAYLYLIIREPNGYGGSPGSFQENGVIISEPFGVYGAQTYRLYNGLSLDQGGILGDYDVDVNIWTWPDEGDTNWNVTVRVAGEIVQEVTGIYSRTQGSSSDSFTYTLESYSSIEDC